jgi:hypothetical protein
MTALPRVRTGLLKHPLDKQVMVYDTRWDQVHLLDPTTACVLELLEEGGWTAEGITAELAVRLDIAPNPALLPLAIEQLRKAPLLDEENPASAAYIDVNRRELLRTAAMAGVAALLIPTVATLTATRGYAQGTAPNHGVGNTCTGNSQCISGNCCNNICIATGAICNTAGSIPNGGACNFTSDCQTAGATCTAGVCKGPTNSTCATGNGCQSGKCCGTPKLCRPSTCSESTANGSCANFGGANNEIRADAACCSGFCQHNGNSANYYCTTRA